MIKLYDFQYFHDEIRDRARKHVAETKGIMIPMSVSPDKVFRDFWRDYVEGKKLFS